MATEGCKNIIEEQDKDIIGEISKSFSVQLIVKDNPRKTFEALKMLQALGYAHNDSTIIVNRVRVPAGYCTDYNHFRITYNAIEMGDHALIYDQVLEDWNREDAISFLKVCSSSMIVKGREPFTNDEVSDFLAYRASLKSSGKK